ncbi:MAG: hypothetical protein R3284_01175, partial [Rubricoccaceae bacterium]|nr:hypothetical protein [Rubricoccaceae bacterium]
MHEFISHITLPLLRRVPPLLICAFALFAGHQINAQGFSVVNGRNHPELDWKVAETQHFEVIYPQHLEGIEVLAATIAEKCYAVLSENFGAITFDEKIRIYLSDEDEIANGSAYPVGSSGFTNIWVHANETAEIWTGNVKWLRKVIAHELAHLFHFKATQSNIGLLQNLVSRPLPSFWTEGLAQYETELWDSERGERWLRTAVFEDRLRTSDGLSRWNGNLLYALGHSQVKYLAEQYGDSTVTNILANRSNPLLGIVETHDFYSALEDEVGISYATFQEDWRKHINVYYNTMAGQMERLDSLHAKPLSLPGQYIYDIRFSPDTTQIAVAVLSSLVRPVRRLFVMNNTSADSTLDRNVRVLAEGAIEGRIAWSPDGSHIAYTRKVRGDNGSLLNDLYLVNVETGDKRRLTNSRRAINPSFNPDGSQLAFVATDRGTANIHIADFESLTERNLTGFEGDVQITSLSWSPRGDLIAASVFDADGSRNLIVFDAVSGAPLVLPTGEDIPTEIRDDRGPVWRSDGGAVAYTSLRDGVPNVFVMELNEEASPEDVASEVNRLIEQRMTQGRRQRTDVDTLETEKPDGLQEQRGGYAESQIVRAQNDSLTVSGQPYTRPREQRVTYLFTGATLHDWLPADSLYENGRLVLVATET